MTEDEKRAERRRQLREAKARARAAMTPDEKRAKRAAHDAAYRAAHRAERNQASLAWYHDNKGATA